MEGSKPRSGTCPNLFKRKLVGPLCYNTFREVDTLQLHAPFDEKERGLAEVRSKSQRISRREEKLASRIRQCLNVLVGIGVGIAAVALKAGCNFLSRVRRQLLQSMLAGLEQGTDEWFTDSGAFLAIAAAMLITAIFTLLASFMVAWKPPAAASGIPPVLAFLNGCDLTGILGGQVLAAKIIGTCFAVGGGLALGPEGPMVHIGAAIGMMIVRRCVSPALRQLGSCGSSPFFIMCKRLESELERQPLRYHVQAAAMGSGAGIAAAFSAPLAGTIFVVEEAASFFSKRLLLHSFITCACAVATANCLGSLLGIEGDEIFDSSYPSCGLNFQFSPLLFVQVAVVGASCGILAGLFNKAIVALAIFNSGQAKRLGKGWNLLKRRFAYALLIGALCGGFSVLVPLCTACEDSSAQAVFDGGSGCVGSDLLPQLVSASKSVPSGEVMANSREPGPQSRAFIPTPGLFGAQYDPVNCPKAISFNPNCAVPFPSGQPPAPYSRTDYCCGFDNLTSLQSGRFYSYQNPVSSVDLSTELWPQGPCPRTRIDTMNSVEVRQFSPAAGLTLTAPVNAVRNLFARGLGPRMLPFKVLSIYLIGYTLLVILSSSVFAPGGLLVPMMAIGAAAGRWAAVVWRFATPHSVENTKALIPWIKELTPLLLLLQPNKVNEPAPGMPAELGVLALAGSAAFLSGSGSLVMFVLVLMVELTLEPFLIPVILLAVIASRCATSLIGTHGLYHELMNVSSLPFLPEFGHWRQNHYVVADLLQEDERRAQHVGQPNGVTADETDLDDETQGAVSFATLRGPPSMPFQAHELPDIGANLITIPVNAGRAEAEAVLRRCLPGDSKPMVNGFPVVGLQGELCGMISREALKELVRQSGQAQHLSNGLGSARSSFLPNVDDSIGIPEAMDTAPFVVQASTPIKHAHMLFSRCGLRHVVVVDSEHKPLGVLTRKSLMPWRTPWMDENMEQDSYVEERAQANMGTDLGSPFISSPRRGSRDVFSRGQSLSSISEVSEMAIRSHGHHQAGSL